MEVTGVPRVPLTAWVTYLGKPPTLMEPPFCHLSMGATEGTNLKVTVMSFYMLGKQG